MHTRFNKGSNRGMHSNKHLAAAYLACKVHRRHRLPHKVCCVLKVQCVKLVFMSNLDKLVRCLCDDAMCLVNASALDQSKSDDNFALIDLVCAHLLLCTERFKRFRRGGKLEHLQESPHPRNKDSARSRCKGRQSFLYFLDFLAPGTHMLPVRALQQLPAQSRHSSADSLPVFLNFAKCFSCLQHSCE